MSPLYVTKFPRIKTHQAQKNAQLHDTSTAYGTQNAAAAREIDPCLRSERLIAAKPFKALAFKLQAIYRILSYPIVSYRILSYPIVSYRILSYPIVSYRILSYPIVSYRILSYLCFSRERLSEGFF